MSSVTSQRSVPLDRESVAAAARRRSTASRTAVASINDFAAYDPSDPKTGMAADPDVEMLFKSKSIADIKVIERNTRSECEQKKEELRLMVGERYRDMIDAADTILDMRDSVTSVVHSIESLLGHCQKIASSSTNPAHEQVQPALHSHGRYVLSRRSMTQIKSDTQRNIFYSVSTQMKLLVDAPEHLWNALEIKQYLKAAKLYLLSEYIYNVLRHNQSISSSLRSHFPILHTQWDSMSGLKSEIASKCALELRHCHVRVEHVASNLLSLILLDELSPTEILTKLLEIRLGSIKDTLSPAASHNPVHLRLLHCVEVVRLTIDQIFPMFVGGADGVLPLLYQYLKQHTAEREHRTKEEFQQIDMAAPPPGSESDISNATLSELFGYNSNTLTLFKHLPLFIQSFRPSLPQKRHVKVPLSEVRELCQQWVVACTDAIAHGVPLVLPAHRNTPTDSSTEAITDSAVEAEEGAHMLTLSELNACRQYILRVISYYCDPNAPQNPARDKQTQQHTHFAPHDTSAEAAATVVVPPSAQLARVHTPTQEGEFYDALSATAWATVCMQVLGHQLDLWDTLLRTPMLTQAQAILSEHFARVSGLVMDTAVDVSAESVSLEIDGRTVGVSAQWQEQDIDLSPVSKEEVTLTPRAREFLIALKRGQTFLEDDPAKADDDSADDSGVDVTEFALPKVASQATTYITLKASSISLSVYGVVAVFDLLVDAIVYDAQGYLGLEPYTGTTGQRGSKARVQETHSINQHLLSLTKGQQAHVHLQSPSAQGLTHTRNRNYDLALSDPTRRNDTSSPHARSPSNTDSASVDASRRSSETGSGFVNVGKVWLDSVSADALVMSERMGGECGLCVQALSAKLQALLQETANVPVADNNGDTTEIQTTQSDTEPVAVEVDGGKERIKRVLLIADIARAIASLSVKIPACVMHGSRKSKYPLSQASSRPLKRLTSVPMSGILPTSADAKALATITTPLQEVAARGVDVWQDWVLQLSRTSLRYHITKDIYTSLQTMSWDVVKINEDNDQGGHVESSISVPSQPHPKLLQFMCTVERLLAHAGGYGWDPTNSARLRRDLCTETLEMIDTFSNISDMPQEGAIQLLFDLSVFVAFLAPRGAQTTDGDITSTVQRLETQIQSKIDPFDLSVLLPYLTENIQLCCRQLSTLLGLLDAGANHAISQHVHKSKTNSKRVKSGVGAGSLNMHNIMMLATPTVRFGTLTVAPLPSEATDEHDSGTLNKPILNVTPSLGVIESSNHADQSESTWSTITNSSAVGEQASQWVQKVGFSGSESIRNFLWGGQEVQQSQGKSASPRTAARKARTQSPSRNKTQNMSFDLGFSGDFI